MKFYCHFDQPKSIKCFEQCILCKRYSDSLNEIDEDVKMLSKIHKIKIQTFKFDPKHDAEK